MQFLSRLGWAMVVGLVVKALCSAEPPPPAAAVVNGEVISEAAVQRELRSLPPEERDAARPSVIRNLIDNLLIDQHIRNKVNVTPSDLAARLKKVQEEAAANQLSYEQLLNQLGTTDADLQALLAADLRWEMFVRGQTDDARLQRFFQENKVCFDGTQMGARHLLIAVPENATPEVRAAARQRLAVIRKTIDAQYAEAVARIDPQADPLSKSELRQQALIAAFAAAANKDSDCPSKKNGGDIGWFPRLGRMVEPFAAAAFALQPGQMSDAVETQFGLHLILATGKMAGKDVKFEDIKEDVRELYGYRLREQLLPGLRRLAQIQIQPVATPAAPGLGAPKTDK